MSARLSVHAHREVRWGCMPAGARSLAPLRISLLVHASAHIQVQFGTHHKIEAVRRDAQLGMQHRADGLADGLVLLTTHSTDGHQLAPRAGRL